MQSGDWSSDVCSSDLEWFPAKERSIAVGYFNVGSSIGAMIAPPLVVWAIVMHSWQMAFIISGVLSFAWAMAWLIFYKHPRDQKKLSDEERDYIINGQESQHQTDNGKKMSVWQILGTRQFWGIALPRFLAEPAWGTFNAWIPLLDRKSTRLNSSHRIASRMPSSA